MVLAAGKICGVVSYCPVPTPAVTHTKQTQDILFNMWNIKLFYMSQFG